VSELAVTDDLAEERGGAAQLAAELTHDPGAALIHVDVLADERSAITVDAAMAVRRQRSHATSQEVSLELLNVAMWGGHVGYFLRRIRLTSCRARPDRKTRFERIARSSLIFRQESFGGRLSGVGSNYAAESAE
jgi:hypothetical protein